MLSTLGLQSTPIKEWAEGEEERRGDQSKDMRSAEGRGRHGKREEEERRRRTRGAVSSKRGPNTTG
eukprot:5146779-Pyramimonas_sp.AAC.1